MSKDWQEGVDRSQLRIDYYKGSGAGGQKRNKTSSACRITHIPTGLVASSEESRSQRANRATAFRRLADQLVPLIKLYHRLGPLREKQTKTVRMYHEPRGEVSDVRVKGTKFNYRKTLEGDLDPIIAAVKAK